MIDKLVKQDNKMAGKGGREENSFEGEKTNAVTEG